MTLTALPEGPITIDASQQQAMRTTGYVSSINGKQGAVHLDLTGGSPGRDGVGFKVPEIYAGDGGNTSFDWGPTIRSLLSSGRKVDLSPNHVYCYDGTITIEAGNLVDGSGGAAAGTNPGLSTLRALSSSAMVWVRGAGSQLRNVLVDGNSLATTVIKVGGTSTGDAGTSPTLDNVTAQLAATGGKNFWISGAQNGVATGCNSINSGGEGWSFTDHAGGWKLTRCESTGSASWNWHLTDSGNITLDTCVLERSTNGTQASVRTDGTIFYPSLRLYGCTTASGGVSTTPTVIATGAAITAATDRVAVTGHGLFTGCPVVLSSLTGGAGLTAGTIYFLVGKATNDFQFAATAGGSPIDITTDGTATVSTVYRYLIDHQAIGTVALDHCPFAGITGEIAVGMRGGVAARLMVDGATHYTGAGLVAMLDFDSSAVIDLDGQLLGQVAGLTVGTVPLRTDRSPDTNVGRFRLSSETIFRSASTLLARASLAIGDTFARFQHLIDGTMGWGPGNATQDVTWFRSAAKTMTLQSAGGTTPVVSKVIGDQYAARYVPLGQPIVTLTTTTTPAIDCSGGDHYIVKTAGFSLNKFTVTNGVTYQDLTIEIKQGAAGGGTFTPPLAADGFLWIGGDAGAPTLPIGANAFLVLRLTLLDNGFWQEVGRSSPEAQLGLGASLFAQQVADTSAVNASTTLVNSALALTLAASAVYTWEAYLLTDASATADFKSAFTWPSGATGWYNGIGAATSGTTYTESAPISASGGTMAFGGAGVGTKLLVVVNGLLTTTTAGTLQHQFAQNTSDATNTLLRAGSYITARRRA